MLLIQNSKSQRERTPGFRDIPACISFQILLYQENSKRRGLIVPPLRMLYCPDTKVEISARNSFSFSKYSRLNFFWYTSVAGEQLQVVSYHASSIAICSWYKSRNFSEKELLVLEIFALEFHFKYLCIRRTARGWALSCHLFECVPLQNTLVISSALYI